jgi:intein/homing endonuclease
LIPTDEGFKYIKDMATEDGWTRKAISVEARTGLEDTCAVFKGTVEPSIKITTKSGYTLEGSHRHPVLVRDGNNHEIWKKLPDIDIGDKVVLRKHYSGTDEYVKIENNNFKTLIDEDFGYLTGLLICKNVYIDENGNIGPRSSAALDLMGTPWYILKSPLSVQKRYLEGLLGNIKLGTVGFESKILSAKIAKEAHIMLLAFCIVASLKERDGAYYITVIYEDYRDFSFVDDIVRIEESTCQMYDLEVPGSHSFVSNGIVSHNSQGSEWGFALIYNPNPTRFVTRKLIYTGFTRAQVMVIYVGDPSTVAFDDRNPINTLAKHLIRIMPEEYEKAKKQYEEDEAVNQDDFDYDDIEAYMPDPDDY